MITVRFMKRSFPALKEITLMSFFTSAEMILWIQYVSFLNILRKTIHVKVIGIPKTIDNDLMCTDHTPGFGSAAKYVAATVQEIARDSSVYSVKSVTVVEIMDDAGWLTASTCVLKAMMKCSASYLFTRNAI